MSANPNRLRVCWVAESLHLEHKHRKDFNAVGLEEMMANVHLMKERK